MFSFIDSVKQGADCNRYTGICNRYTHDEWVEVAKEVESSVGWIKTINVQITAL